MMVYSAGSRFLLKRLLALALSVAAPAAVSGANAGDGSQLFAETESFERLVRRLHNPASIRPTIYRRGIEEIVTQAAERHRVPPALILAVIRCESDFDPYAVSPKGARGLMQVMPRTAAGTFGIRDVDQLFVPEVNIEIGTAYLRLLANRYRGDAVRVLSAYNAGSGRVDAGRIPAETRAYVRCVHRTWRDYATTGRRYAADGRETP